MLDTKATSVVRCAAMNISTKTCKICAEEKLLYEFSKHPTAKYGVSNTCKLCAKALSKHYRTVNAEVYKQKDRIRNQTTERQNQRKAWEDANREKRRAQERARDAANRAEVNAKQRKWRQDNPEKERVYTARWRDKNRDLIRANMREYSIAYRVRNPDKVLASTHRYRKHVKGNGGSFTGEEWANLKTRYGGKCLMCGAAEPKVKLSPDHVIPVSKGGRNDINNIQPLCRVCNRMKSDRDWDFRTIIGTSNG